MLTRITQLLFVVLVILTGCSKQTSTVVIQPVLENWTFHAAGDTNRYAAAVPGGVHLDLLENQLIPDPFWKENEAKVQWIEREDWVYETTFWVDKDVLTKNHVQLRFKGLDTQAIVTLNDYLILRADNMFREWVSPCKDPMVYGHNTLRVRFRSSVLEDSVKAERLGYPLPDNRVFTRKAPYQGGWDWGPRLVTSGIWRPVQIEAWDGARLEDIHIIQKELNSKTAELEIRADIISNVDTDALIRIVIDNQKGIIKKRFKAARGNSSVSIPVSIPNPRLWWTHDQGDPHLYGLTVVLNAEDGSKDQISKRIGLRTIEVKQIEDAEGSSFEFHLNGRPVFMKGANYIPQDSFVPRVTPEKTKRLLNSAKDAHMNMIRIWGGGIYESDYFYELCDEMGILIWQDFMFACAMYPGDGAFIENVRQEAVFQVKRLRHHPSIAMWCGNNEIAEGWRNWGWQDIYKWTEQQENAIWQAYEDVFHAVLPEVIQKYDPGRFYWPTSPKIGWGHDEAFKTGDAHYWGVWWGRLPFEMYDEKTGRFMSEWGFQGMPPMETIKSFTDTEDRYLNSSVMKAHQKHPFGDENIAEYMARDFHMPEDFQDYVYVSQCLQAYGVGRGIEAHRRNKPYCMGTLYWQLNDCWPAISWSGLDFYGRWKALHYEAKRLYQPVALLHEIKENVFSLYINNDSPEIVEGALQLELQDFYGNRYNERIIPFTAEPGGNIRILRQSMDELLKGVDKRQYVLTGTLHTDQEIQRRIFHLARPKDQKLPLPNFSFYWKQYDATRVITISTDVLARYVYLEAEGVHFKDNFFDIQAGDIIRIAVETEKDIEEIKMNFKIRSLADIQPVLYE